MIFSEEIVCQICKEKYSKLGLANHLLYKHKMTLEIYKRRYIYKFKKCKNCGKRIIHPKKFCSPRSVNVYRSSKVKNRNPIITNKEIIKKGFNKIPESKRKEIAQYYKDNIVTFLEISNKFNVSEEILKEILKHYGIKPYNCRIFQKKALKDKKEKFLRSSIGKKILREYREPGGNIRSLSRKYGIHRRTLRKMLISSEIQLKSNKEARNETEKVKRSRGLKGHRYGKDASVGSGICSWYFYEGIKYQGSWEFKLGLWFKSEGIKFICHEGVKRFEYRINEKTFTYCPDFYLLEENNFVEVKGYFSEKDKRKMEIVRKTYPEISFEIYDKKRLDKNNILDIDKKYDICIEDYVLNYKTNKLYMDFLKEIDVNELVVKNIVERQNLQSLAKQYNVPYLVMCRAFYKVVPKLGIDKFYSFCFQKFFTKNQIDLIEKSPSIRKVVELIDNGLRYKRNHEIIRRFKKGILCH